MFGRASKPTPAPAPRQALPNGVRGDGSNIGAPKFQLTGALWARRSQKTWLRPAPRGSSSLLAGFDLSRQERLAGGADGGQQPERGRRRLVHEQEVRAEAARGAGAWGRLDMAGSESSGVGRRWPDREQEV